MTITELTYRIDERVSAAREEIARLEGARDALTATTAVPTVVTAPSARHRRERPAAPSRSATDRRPRSAIVAALARELDAGLRTRV
jgi:hypothetical protein